MEPFETKKEIGKKIRLKREELGKSQDKFGKLVGVHKQQISRYERGLSRPRDKILRKILEYGEPIQDYLNVSESREPYQVQTPKQKLLDNVAKVLESGNEVVIDILKANIKASLEAVQSKNPNQKEGD